MKKGFTLVEILGVIVVLGVIGLIAFPIVNSTIKETKQNSYDAQIKMIVEAGQKWGVKNVEKLPDINETKYIKISELIEEGLIVKTKGGKLINPIDDTEMTGCVKVSYLTDYNQYSYEYSEVCG